MEDQTDMLRKLVLQARRTAFIGSGPDVVVRHRTPSITYQAKSLDAIKPTHGKKDGTDPQVKYIFERALGKGYVTPLYSTQPALWHGSDSNISTHIHCHSVWTT